MSTSKVVKAMGWKSLKELGKQESRNVDTLSRWHKNAPELFERWLADAWKRKLKDDLMN